MTWKAEQRRESRFAVRPGVYWDDGVGEKMPEDLQEKKHRGKPRLKPEDPGVLYVKKLLAIIATRGLWKKYKEK